MSSVSGGGGGRNDQILMQDQRASGTGGSTYGNLTWRTMPLNTKVTDTGANVSGFNGAGGAGANQFILVPGSYVFWAEASVGTGPTIIRTRLQDVTTPATMAQGVNASGSVPAARVSGILVIAAPKTFELQTWMDVGSGSNPALSTGAVEIYASIWLRRYL